MCKEEIKPIDELIDDDYDWDDDYEESDYPCDNCEEPCDQWEASYCCRRCMWYNDDPDCSECDPWEI